MPGFDYRIQLSKSGIPIFIMRMTPNVRLNLLRYGNIMFLYSQKRQYNEIRWPYMGPVNKRVVTAEAIITSEDTETYTCVFQSVHSIEKRWSLSKFQVIHGNGLITKSLSTNLRIEEMYVLHGDYYHLFKKRGQKHTILDYITIHWLKNIYRQC